eukprot:gene1625-12750_t
MAQVCENIEQYSDMYNFMKEYIKINPSLSSFERDLFSVSSKFVVGDKRASLRIMDSFISRKNNIDIVEFNNLKQKIEKELFAHVKEKVFFLDNFLIPNSKDLESKVMYYKMKGDCFRYNCQYVPRIMKKEILSSATSAYLHGFELAKNLGVANPTRLGLSLNMGVFYYEDLCETKKAISFTKECYDDAMKTQL